MNKLLLKAFDPEAFRTEGHKLIDLLANYLTDCSNGHPMPVLPPSEPEELLSFWQAEMKQPGFNLQGFYKTLLEQSNHIHHPGYIGHQVVPPAPLSALSELLEALLNNGMAIYEMGPAATAIEKVVMGWLSNHIGFGAEADGMLTSGGSAGNLTALLAARQAMSTNNVWDEGNDSTQPLALMVSEEAHYSVSRAARIMGWGEKGIVKVPVNNRMQLDASKLEETLRDAQNSGIKVIAIVGNACSTSTGTYDPLDEMADFAKQHGIWFHIDGAHGGAAVMTEKYKYLTKGINRADSVVIDFHKMMLTPALTTAVIFRNGKHSYETFAQKAEYLLSQTRKPWFDGANRTLECTKKMLAVKVYAMIRLYGDELFREYITNAFDLGQDFAALINKQPDFELAIHPDCNIVCFRYCPENYTEDLNTLNASIREHILKDARFYVVQTQVNGKIFLRLTLMNPFTTIDILNDLLRLIRKDYAQLQ